MEDKIQLLKVILGPPHLPVAQTPIATQTHTTDPYSAHTAAYVKRTQQMSIQLNRLTVVGTGQFEQQNK